MLGHDDVVQADDAVAAPNSLDLHARDGRSLPIVDVRSPRTDQVFVPWAENSARTACLHGRDAQLLAACVGISQALASLYRVAATLSLDAASYAEDTETLVARTARL